MRDAMLAAGFDPPPDLIADGAIHRFPTNGRANDDAGWYWLLDDAPVGGFGNWREGRGHKWTGKPEAELTARERAEMSKRLAETRKLREDEQAKARTRAAETWSALKGASASHPYLRDKGVQPHGARLAGDRLAIPMLDSTGRIHCLQFIRSDGRKRFSTHGRAKGLYLVLGEPGPTILLAEGFATAASLREATGLPVAIAFSCENLGRVAGELRKAWPESKLVVCADDDWKREGNPGVTAAKAAATAVGGFLAVPLFDSARPDTATDFNDLQQLEGAEAVRGCVDEAQRATRPEPSTSEPSAPVEEDEPSAPARSDAPMHATQAHVSPLLGSFLLAAIERAKRRCSGIEKPIPLPWSTLNDHFGGGLWPGLHIVNSGTGAGKTQFALQVGTLAAKREIPTLYIGLELSSFELALRQLGEEGDAPWSKLFTGTAGPVYLDRVREAEPRLRDLPFHCEAARPLGFSPSAILEAAEAMRRQYPESDGPGSRPLLLIVDFLQLVGDELGEMVDVRIRIGRASYVLREIANRLGFAVLCVSSVARDRYNLPNEIQRVAGLKWDLDEEGRPIKRRVLNPDAVVGVGKESGEIEFSADSVSVLVRVPESFDGDSSDMVFITAKGRATGARWSPLRFTGFRYQECEDGGVGVLEAWATSDEKRERLKTDRQAARETAKTQRAESDVETVRAYVLANPGCSTNEARENTVNNFRRWKAVELALGPALVRSRLGGQKYGLSIDTRLEPEPTESKTKSRSNSPLYPPLLDLDSVSNRGPVQQPSPLSLDLVDSVDLVLKGRNGTRAKQPEWFEGKLDDEGPPVEGGIRTHVAPLDPVDLVSKPSPDEERESGQDQPSPGPSPTDPVEERDASGQP